ncbi:hypothetical protein [Nocardia sp. CS682]|uniref:hypothetical protein n=1 Tax=Nocardia sp. CS682 TaxID=1047172 RepID=UPI0010751742|nr:hypothetical protein [Nocardia sp. CS682]
MLDLPPLHRQKYDLTPTQSQALYSAATAFEAGAAGVACAAIPVVGPYISFVCGAVMAGVMRLMAPEADDYYTITVKYGILGPEVSVQLNHVIKGTAIPAPSELRPSTTPTGQNGNGGDNGNGNGRGDGNGGGSAAPTAPPYTPQPAPPVPATPTAAPTAIPVDPPRTQPSPPQRPDKPCTGACLA